MDGGEANPSSASIDIDMADLAFLDATTAAAASTSTAASTRFRPKTKPKPKPKPAAEPKPEPKPEPEIRPKTEPDTLASPSAMMVAASSHGEMVAEANGGDAMEVNGVGREQAEEEEEEEDFVVREIDVYFTPDRLDEDTLLYIMQYPLRPCWRPYALDEVCDEVRVKPNCSKVEVDLTIDSNPQNYDPEVAAPLRLPKQTLSSSEAPNVADYAVGILRGNLVHLNHIDAVVQLRPSMSHVNAEQQSIRRTMQQGEMNSGTDGLTNPSITLANKDSVSGDQQKEDSEPWISLAYHPSEGNTSRRYHDRMISNEGGPIDFTMRKSDYVVSLCPGTLTESKDTKERRARREMMLLPLEQRLKKWLTEVSQVNRFDALMHLAPTHSEEDVLKVLQLYADLVRGLWVCKSSLLYDDDTAFKRDFVLLQFTKKEFIQISELEKRGIKGELLKEIMGPLSVPRKLLKECKFILPMDSSFIKRYPQIVKDQECAWSAREMTVLDSLSRLNKTDTSKIKNLSKANVSSGTADPSLNRARHDAVISAAEGTDNHLHTVLGNIFTDRKVRSMQAVVRDLRQLSARYASDRKDRPKLQALSNAARKGASLPQDELRAFIVGVAVPVHGVYVAKPALMNSLRNVLIKLFHEKAPHGKLTKQEILERGTKILKREIADKEYHQGIRAAGEVRPAWCSAWWRCWEVLGTPVMSHHEVSYRDVVTKVGSRRVGRNEKEVAVEELAVACCFFFILIPPAQLREHIY